MAHFRLEPPERATQGLRAGVSAMADTSAGKMAQSEKHALHRHLVSTERKASISYDKNVRPLIVKRDIDFSENG